MSVHKVKWMIYNGRDQACLPSADKPGRKICLAADRSTWQQTGMAHKRFKPQ